ncbi:MAG: hypothetical protein HY513_01570 [Candidatus Aenigmarchaeota archaeon]|nr:hypothetical protein [Candidatus Aenigmarchaeota archaeon]
MRKSKRKNQRYRTSKYAPNVYDVSVITGFVILLLTVTYVSVEPENVAGQGGKVITASVPDINYAGKAYASLDDIICLKNDYGDIVCSSVGELVKADDKLFANCVSEIGCTLSCVELTNACTDDQSYSACALQNKFC